VARYGRDPVRQGGRVTALRRDGPLLRGGGPDGLPPIRARHVLLATGSRDVEPELPGLPDAVRRGLVRYCPICDGYESRSTGSP
jgi:thioredoxin reductase (NADPH)